MTTVRSQEKANRIKEAYPKYGEDKLSFALVEDIAKEGGTFIYLVKEKCSSAGRCVSGALPEGSTLHMGRIFCGLLI